MGSRSGGALYQIFYDGEEPPAPLQPTKANPRLWGFNGADARFLMQLCRALSRTKETDRQLLLAMARKMASKAV
jgi:hypothetical protein